MLASLVFLAYIGVTASQADADTALKSSLLVLLSLSSAICGSLFLQRWRELTLDDLVGRSGESAIRVLKLLLMHISDLREQIVQHRQKMVAMAHDTSLIEFSHDYLEKECMALTRYVESAIGDWSSLIKAASHSNSTLRLELLELQEKYDGLKADSSTINIEMKDLEDIVPSVSAVRSSSFDTEVVITN
jgi:FtsZ-binding cell division protein ZapB